MINAPLLIMVSLLFALIIASYSKKNWDFVAVSLLCCFTAATITTLVLRLDHTEAVGIFIAFIEWEAIILILSMSIITKIAQDSNILEYIAVKLFKLSKGNQRTFFYLLCIITTFLAAIISDVVVVIILAPVVIRLCHFLKIRAGTYLLGMTVCINIGSILTPFSSGENIIIATAFNLTTADFLVYWLFAIPLLFLTIFLIDRLYLSKEPRIDDLQRKYVMDLIDADVMIENKKMFIINSIAILITIILFVVLGPVIYLVAATSALIMVIINKRYTKNEMSDMLKDIEWEIIFFFIALYVVIGCMIQAGFSEFILNLIPFEKFGLFFLCLIILLVVSLLSGAVANTPTALIFIPIISSLIYNMGFPALPLLFALIIGINLGGNFLPQGAACDMMTLKIAEDNGVENLSKQRLLKTGASFALIHIAASIGFLYILVFFFV